MPLRNLIIVAIAVLVSLACYSVAAKNRYANLFAEAMEVIDKEALRVVPKKDLFVSAMDGMMKRLDEHSAFIAGERFKEFDEDMRQEFGGVGMYVETNPENKRLFVLSPIPDTPAFAAGLQIGDEIIEIDGENVDGEDRSEAIKRLRGPIGEPVELTIERDGETLKKKIVRAAIPVPSVSGDYRSPDGKWNFLLKEHPRFGYIRLSQFGEKSAAEIQAVLKQTSGKIDGLILDLRNNPGGLLDVAIEICDFFVDKGDVIVSTRGRGGELLHEPYTASNDPIVKTGLPIVVLVNRFSASASEIVAGCLQDHHRAIVIGEQSYGKGTVQNVIPMQRGSSALKLTTASYWRPSGINIDRHDELAQKTQTWGVQPDTGYKIEMTESEIFDNLRFRNLRDLEGLIPAENGEMFEAIKRMRMKINLLDVDANHDADSDLLPPANIDQEENESSESSESSETTESPETTESSETDDMDYQPHVDRPLERAIEYFRNVVAGQRIAA